MSESEQVNSEELFKGNPYLELFGSQVDQALYGVAETSPRVEAIIKMAELYEQRTANMLRYAGEEKRSTLREYKEELRERVQAEKPQGPSITRLQ